jgi:hypothetical protein
MPRRRRGCRSTIAPSGRPCSSVETGSTVAVRTHRSDSRTDVIWIAEDRGKRRNSGERHQITPLLGSTSCGNRPVRRALPHSGHSRGRSPLGDAHAPRLLRPHIDLRQRGHHPAIALRSSSNSVSRRGLSGPASDCIALTTARASPPSSRPTLLILKRAESGLSSQVLQRSRQTGPGTTSAALSRSILVP